MYKNAKNSDRGFNAIQINKYKSLVASIILTYGEDSIILCPMLKVFE